MTEKRKKLLWHIYPSYLLIVLLSLLAVGWYASRSYRELYYAQTAEDLEARARLVADQINDPLSQAEYHEVQRLCLMLGRHSSTRLTVILPNGQVVADSMEDPERMENHRDRPEVMGALRSGGGKGIVRRFSSTLDEDMMYVAFLIEREDERLGVIRAALSVASLETALRELYLRIAVGGLLILLAAALLSLLVSRRISRPLNEMRQGAERFARGELDHRLLPPEAEELAALTESMNRMAAELNEKIHTVVEQRNELEVVLAGMVEGVLVLDLNERILRLNQSAAQLFNLSPAYAEGRSIQETIRNTDIQAFVTRVLRNEGGGPVESEIALGPERERILQAHGTILRNARQGRMGALIVLHDVTNLKRLEKIRREFVGNVSHELKTPITSIKGFVETLLDGALDDPENARRFLEIIAKHSDRLGAIIEDLLSLSRIEQEAEREQIPLDILPLKPVLQTTGQLCHLKAQEKNILINVQCDDELRAPINPALLEQAVVNLVDNAIKYSEEKAEVMITARKEEGEVRISVVDRGAGIEAEHIPRLFERFYRVDKARSRQLGGTGLGLAIVKHIVQAHHGKITVESRPGAGSTFTIHLPSLS